MKRKLPFLPVFPFLLPLFFVLHGVAENAAYIDIRDCWGLLGVYMAVTVGLYLLLYLFYRDHSRTALAVGTLQGIFFFFGALHGFLSRYVPPLSKYIIILPLLAILQVVVLIRLKKSSFSPRRPVLFMNILFLIYILFDLIRLGLPDDAYRLRLSLTSPYTVPLQAPDSAYPDVYLLLMDEYASTSSLRTWFNYDNSSLDSFLSNEGFRLLPASRSNYNFTSFSMASMLNMSYLKGLGNECTIADYASCNKLIRNSEAVRSFSMHGYDIINYSIFDLDDQPSTVNEHLLPVKTNLITAQTLLGRIRRDIGWNIYSLPLDIGWIRQWAYQVMDNNNGFIAGVEKTSNTRTGHPRFIYAHLQMPHNPFFYDKQGRLKEPKEMEQNIEGYLDYLPYTNEVIKKLVTAIQQHSHRSAVIMLMGDHGVRYEARGGGDPDDLHYFQNLNAVYFPDKDYHLFYDSVSGVNQFRIVFSKIFHQNIPLLRDSTILLKDRQY